MDKISIGKNIKERREIKGISSLELAEFLKVDLNFIDQLEKDKIDPTVSELLKIARILETDITALIHGRELLEKKAIVSKSGTRVKVERKNDLTYESLAPLYSGRNMEPFIVEVFKEKEENQALSQHIGEEFHYVLEGTLAIVIERKEYILKEGDSIYFNSDLPHQLYSINGSAKVLAVIYNSDSMLKYTQSNQMKNLILAAKHLGGKNISVICPDKTVMLAVNKGIEEGIINKAFIVGEQDLSDQTLLKYPDKYEIFSFKTQGEEYYYDCADFGVNLITEGQCQLIMKGKINTAIFVKAILNKKAGIMTDRRLSLTGIFELPGIKRLIFLTDPGINPALVIGNDYTNSIDIIENGIDVARGLGVVNPKVALLEANEKPSKKIPTTIFEKELSEMDWGEAEVFGPLSYDLALYEESVKKKGLKNNPVGGKADVLVVPYISGGNFLYKAWTMTLNAEVATIVAGAKVPVILTSRSDNERTKFLTLCAGSVYSQYLQEKQSEKKNVL